MRMGDKIQQHRKKHGWSQSELAEKIDVSRQTVSKWELGETMPDTENVLKLCALFEIEAGALLNDACDLCSPNKSADIFRAPQGTKRKNLCRGVALLVIGILITGTLVTLSHFIPSRQKFVQSVMPEATTGLDAELAETEMRTVYSYMETTGLLPFLNTYYLHWLFIAGVVCIAVSIYFLAKSKQQKDVLIH